MSEQGDAAAIGKALQTRQINKAVEHLMGMVTGMVADASLHDLEIKLLSTWVSDNAAVVTSWPGFVVARKLREVLEDGVITTAERAHLLKVLTELAGSDFSLTGSATPEVAALPINDVVTVDLRNMGVCHSGEFIFGTRASCERLTLKAGGMPMLVVEQNELLAASADRLVVLVAGKVRGS